jgi:hypothetical protein
MLKRQASGPRIAVVGNCQSFGIAYAMRLLDLEAEVAQFSIVSKSWTDMRTLARTLQTYDHVFAQDFAPGYLRGGRLRRAAERARWRRLVPVARL